SFAVQPLTIPPRKPHRDRLRRSPPALVSLAPSPFIRQGNKVPLSHCVRGSKIGDFRHHETAKPFRTTPRTQDARNRTATAAPPRRLTRKTTCRLRGFPRCPRRYAHR